MKKLSAVFICAMFFCLLPNTIYAGPLNAAEVMEEVQEKELDFRITSEIDLSKKSQSTFDSSRTISGVADQGTAVAINVSTKDADGEWKDPVCYETLVGASGLFSHTVELTLGDNLVEVSASLEGYETISKSTIIKRKKMEIKTELENTISVPGSARTPLFSTK